MTRLRTVVALAATMPSWMLARLKRETQQHSTGSDADRMQPFTGPARAETYTSHLCRIWGFEAPVEATFARTAGLADVIDLRGRGHMKLLRADLLALGISSPSELPYCRAIPTFASVAEALGWMYVVEHNALFNGQLRRHLEKLLPKQLASAGSYLSNGERAIGSRLSELGLAFDRFACTPDLAKQIVEAANLGFRRQRLWFAQGLPSDDRRRPTRLGAADVPAR